MSPRLKLELRGYQNRTATWLYEHREAIGVLDLGAGKTAAALTAIAELLDDEVIRHALIVAPKRVAEITWPDEVAAWEHTDILRMSVVSGTPRERARILGCATTRDLTVVGIDNVQWLVEQLQPLDDGHPLFDLLLIDEISKLKSPTSKRAKALLGQAPRFRNRWGLTGTPRPNGEQDLFMPAAVITAGKLWGRSFTRWQQQRFYSTDLFGYDWRIKPEWVAPTAAEFSRIAITLDESDMPDLPEMNVVIDPVRLPDDVWQAYRDMQRELVASIDTSTVEAASQAIATGKLAQMVAGFLYEEDGGDGRGRTVRVLHQEKLLWLDDIVEALDGKPLLVVYEFVEDARRLVERYGCPVIGGGTSAPDSARSVRDWNEGSLPMLAIHPASAGHGLNLQQGGSHMAWLGLTWSAELYEQTIKRIHRPGQLNRVTIHIPVVAGSVDELKRDRVVKKMSAQDAFRAFLGRV